MCNKSVTDSTVGMLVVPISPIPSLKHYASVGLHFYSFLLYVIR